MSQLHVSENEEFLITDSFDVPVVWLSEKDAKQLAIDLVSHFALKHRREQEREEDRNNAS